MKFFLPILTIIWLIGAVVDRFWFALDRSIPAWDEADYLNGAMNYWHAFQTPQWFNGEWWHSLWLLSSKIPPLTYIATVPFFNLFGQSEDSATLLLLVFSFILLVSVYSLGTAIFNKSVGFWAAGLCQLLPGLYRYRTEFLLDYPLTAVVTLSFCCLTIWKFQKSSRLSWLWAAIFGLTFGIALMVKQTTLLFLIVPLLWITGCSLVRRQWVKLAQLIFAFCCSSLIFGWWYKTNWLLILTSGKRATIDSAIAEGDPALNSIDAWIYYLKILPLILGWHLLLIPLVCFLLYIIKKGKLPIVTIEHRWLIIFLVGGYLISSLNLNKDARYILPLLPVLSLFLAAGLLSWTGRWQNYIRFGTIALAFFLMLLNFFPLPGAILTQIISPRVEHYPYLGKPFPHQQVIEKIIQTEPYLRSTLAVLPSTATINQHNLTFYGLKENFQVYSRQVGVREKDVKQDGRSLDWFLTKTGDRGSVPNSEAAMVKYIETSPDFRVQNSWQLPDRSILKLYHRTETSVEVKSSHNYAQKIRLDKINVPDRVPPGVPIPITYTWSGSWEDLESGLVLLTWKNDNNSSQWLHDRAIGMGRLQKAYSVALGNNFQVIERTAMLPGKDVATGSYYLEATYLDRNTGETYPIAVPKITVNIDLTAPIPTAPELDLVTQLRVNAAKLNLGEKALDSIFAETARINQYDPIQDYLKQAAITLNYRLQDRQQGDKLNWAYGVTLAEVLQRDIKGSIAALQKVIELDKNNPYNYAYLAFVYLYDWQAIEAQKVLKPALEINPNLRIIQILDGVSALMQGNLFKVFQILPKLN
jgi:4-amino-4-deoxy-L-arabinose transferase-like glycosyltransferase